MLDHAMYVETDTSKQTNSFSDTSAIVSRSEFENHLAHVIETCLVAGQQHCLACFQFSLENAINLEHLPIEGVNQWIEESARIFQNNTRGHDAVMPASLEEFYLLLPNCTTDNARTVLNRIINDMARLTIETDSSINGIRCGAGLVPIHSSFNNKEKLLRISQGASFAAIARGNFQIQIHGLS